MRTNLKGLVRANQVYNEPFQRVRELKRKNRKVIGYLCVFAPPEIMAAAGIFPYRLRGDMKRRTDPAAEYVESFGCPYVRNCFSQAIDGKFNFLDGLVMSHACDMVQRIYGIWSYTLNPKFHYMVNVPHTVTPWSRDFFKRELGFFIEKIEALAGRGITEKDLIKAIQRYNESRGLVRELYEFRKSDPPLLSGSEMLQILVAGMSLPIDEFIEVLKECRDEIHDRKSGSSNKRPRILVWGSINDDISLVNLIEECGAYVVTDDLCVGTKSYWHDIDLSSGPIEGLTRFYFEDFSCPRTYKGSGMERFGYLGSIARSFNVDGVIAYTISFCDPYKLDLPDILKYFTEMGLPVLAIEDDYTMSNKEAIKTRIQAFVEMIEQKRG